MAVSDSAFMGFQWRKDSGDFSRLDGQKPAHFILEQVEQDRFRLVDGFRFTRPTGQTIDVRPEFVKRTDLATVPRPLGWFVSRHGLHTPAALLHDQLCDHEETRPDGMSRDDIDVFFLEAMKAAGVGPIRRLIRYAGVVWWTRVRLPWLFTIAMTLWLAAAAGGMASLAFVCAAQAWWWLPVPLLAQFVAAILWLPGRYWAGVVAGYALPFVLFPGLVCWLFYTSYWLPGWLWYGTVRGFRALTRTAAPLPPKPTGYKQR